MRNPAAAQRPTQRSAWDIPARSIAKQCADQGGRRGLWGKRPLNQPLGYGQVNAGFRNPKKSEATAAVTGAASIAKTFKEEAMKQMYQDPEMGASGECL